MDLPGQNRLAVRLTQHAGELNEHPRACINRGVWRALSLKTVVAQCEQHHLTGLLHCLSDTDINPFFRVLSHFHNPLLWPHSNNMKLQTLCNLKLLFITQYFDALPVLTKRLSTT